MAPTQPHRQAWSDPLILAALLVFPACGQVYKYAGAAGTIAYATLVLMACILVCRHVEALARLGSPRLWAAAMIVLGVVGVAAFVVLFPIAQSGAMGQGSDRDEALNLGLSALAQGRYPYYEKTYLGNMLTPLPGALLLAAPAWMAGDAAWQNLYWPILLLAFLWRSFTPVIATLLAGAGVMLNPGVLQDIVTGGDFYANAIYVLLATAAAMTTARGSRAVHLAALAFLGVAVCSRPIYAVAPVALAALFWRHIGLGAAARALAVPGVVALALTLPFYLYDPAGFAPLHVASKADLPIPHAAAVLGVLSLAVAAVATRLPFDAFALYGWIAVALSAAFVPVMIKSALVGEYFYLAGIATPVTLFGGLWLAKRMERRHGLGAKDAFSSA